MEEVCLFLSFFFFLSTFHLRQNDSGKKSIDCVVSLSEAQKESKGTIFDYEWCYFFPLGVAIGNLAKQGRILAKKKKKSVLDFLLTYLGFSLNLCLKSGVNVRSV